MALSRGSSLGSYEVIDLLGAGGMGEVYRARDSRLGRSVAVKVLPEAVAADPERVARFEREAKVLGSLNHPHIATVHGFEHFEGRHFLVMELVEGDTLADRLRRGAMPASEAIAVARQIAEALEAAHENGVVHRDLKPANVKITPDDRVKVLDFGLAKAFAAAEGEGLAVSNSPTLSVMATQAGLILGTAAYMSPEQAKGLPADARSDVFSFGAVLFEMLSGRQAFNGEMVPDILASVLARDPDWNALPTTLNPRLRSLLQRCLAKHRKQRWQAIGDVRAELELMGAEPQGTTAAAAVSRKPLWRRALAPLAAAVLASIATAAVFWYFTPKPRADVTRFQIALPDGRNWASAVRQLIDLSPDGTQIAFTTSSGIYLRSMSDLEPRLLQGAAGNPAFSPDGRSIAFVASGAIQKIPVTGGTAVTLCPSDQIRGIEWSPEGIFFAQPGGIYKVSASGGTPVLIVKEEANTVLQTPRVLPGQRLLFSESGGQRASDWDTANIVVQSLTTGERKVIITGGADARYLPSGHLVYATRGLVLAVPFDVDTLQVKGEPVPLIEGVMRAPAVTGIAHFATSRSGSLVYIPGIAAGGSAQRAIVIADHDGQLSSPKLPLGAYETPRVSPDGKQIAFSIDDRKEVAIWIYDLAGTTSMRRLTFDGTSRYPIWTRDGQRVAYQVTRSNESGIAWQRADGHDVPQQLTKADPGTSHVPESWSSNDRFLLYSVVSGATASLWVLDRTAGKSSRFEGVESMAPLGAVFSPDDRWVAYGTRPGGATTTVFVQPFPQTGAKYQVSRDDDGHHPVWSPDGKRLYYIPGPGSFLYVSVETTPAVRFGTPVPVQRAFTVSNAPTEVRGHDITPDGKRFVGLTLGQEAPRGAEGLVASGGPFMRTMLVVVNWFEDLKQRAPVP